MKTYTITFTEAKLDTAIEALTHLYGVGKERYNKQLIEPSAEQRQRLKNLGTLVLALHNARYS